MRHQIAWDAASFRNFDTRMQTLQRAYIPAAQVAVAQVGATILDDAEKIPPTVPKAGLQREIAAVRAARLRSVEGYRHAKKVLRRARAGGRRVGGTLRGSGTVKVLPPVGMTVEAEIVYDVPYAAPMHAGRWVTGPLAGVTVKRWSEPGSGPNWLGSKLQRFRGKYIGIFVTVARRMLRM